MLCLELPPGWDFEPLHKTCPKCGCDLSKEFVAPEHNEGGANDVEYDADGNKRGWYDGEILEEPGTSKDENKDSHDHEDLVPVVKRNLGKRIIHWLLRRDSGRHNDQVEGAEPLLAKLPLD